MKTETPTPEVITAPPGHIYRLSYLLPSGDELSRNVMYCESIRPDALGMGVAVNAFKQDVVTHPDRPLLFCMCHRVIGDVVFEFKATSQVVQEIEDWMKWDEEQAAQEVQDLGNQEGSELLEEVARLFFVPAGK